MRLLSAFLALLLCSALPIEAAPAARTSPTVTAKPLIEQVRGRTVRVRVPAGLHSVTLERCTSVRHARWEIVGTRATGQTAGTIEFQLAQAISRRFLRVKGATSPATTGPLTGARLFLADPALAGSGVFGGGAQEKTLNISTLAASADSAGAAAPRLVSESDIWRVAGDRLYFFNELRGLQVFDITDPDDPALLGQLRASGRGEQMYLLDAAHVALLICGSDYVHLPVRILTTLPGGNAGDSSLGSIVVVDVAQGRPVEVARVHYRGTLRESRRVGSVLYVVSEVWNGNAGGLEVTSFDLSDPAQPVQRDTLSLSGWGGVIHATDRFLFVVSYSHDWSHSLIDVIDITSPTGVLARRGRIAAAGVVQDKFKMHLDGDTFTTVSAIPRRFDGNAWWTEPADANASRTKIETFSLAHPDAPAALGSLTVGVGETVRATRFDDKRLYVVTFFQIDPLWVIDLANPATPTLLGELEIPGFSTYIEPLGDRLVAVGRLDDQTAVSLFDVSDPTRPLELEKLTLGDGSSWSEANWDEKAFNVLPEENLIVVPFSGYDPETGYASRVQLIDLTRDTLAKRGVIDHGLAARRTAVKDNRLLAISSTDLVTVDFADRDHPRVTSEVEIAWRVDRVILAGDYLLQIGGSANWRQGQQQSISVSTASDPDTVLTTVALDPVNVLGATMRDGRLYIAQRNPEWYSDLVYAPDSPNGTPAPTANPFILSVFDLTSLPALPRLARTESEAQLGWTSGLDAAWPSSDVLVWVRKQQSRVLFGGVIGLETPVLRVANPASAALGSSATITAPITLGPTGVRTSAASQALRPWPGDSGAGHEALVFDVSTPTAPVLASRLNIRTGSTGHWSDPFAATGKLYVSSVAYEDYVTIGETPATPANTPSRRYRHFLKVVDLTNPVHPAIGADISIPGRLIGLSNAGGRLYTAGCRYEIDGTPTHTRAVHASSFDGSVATFIDQVALADYGAAFALDRDTVLIGVRSHDGTQDKVEAWQLDQSSNFQRMSQTPVSDAGTLTVLRGLLVVGGYFGSGRQLFDVTDAINVRPLGSFPQNTNYWHGSDLSRADGSPSRGLWEPLGNYGVEFLVFAP